MLLMENINGVPTIYASLRGQRLRLRGITKLLRACFYPTYKWGGRQGEQVDHECAQDMGYDWLPVDKRRAAAAKRRVVKGASLGTDVDYQLRLFANAPAKFVKMGSGVRATTKDVITAYASWGWRVQVSQFPVGAPDLRLGTPIDMIALDGDDKPVLIENKTGYDDTLHKSSGHMRGPLSDVDDRPLHQFFLQLFTELLLVKYYWGLDFGTSAYVVQANTRGVTPYQIPEWLLRRERQVWAYFSEFASMSGPGPAKRSAPDRYRNVAWTGGQPDPKRSKPADGAPT